MIEANFELSTPNNTAGIKMWFLRTLWIKASFDSCIKYGKFDDLLSDFCRIVSQQFASGVFDLLLGKPFRVIVPF